MTALQKLEQGFSVANLAAAPLVITFVLSASVVITTTVTGDARQYATVAIFNGSVSLWSATLTQFTPAATIPYDIVAGDLVIKEGGKLSLTIPTTLQSGSTVASLTIATLNNPQGVPFQGVIASWPLSS